MRDDAITKRHLLHFSLFNTNIILPVCMCLILFLGRSIYQCNTFFFLLIHPPSSTAHYLPFVDSSHFDMYNFQSVNFHVNKIKCNDLLARVKKNCTCEITILIEFCFVRAYLNEWIADSTCIITALQIYCLKKRKKQQQQQKQKLTWKKRYKHLYAKICMFRWKS